jgi:hypothetical protein
MSKRGAPETPSDLGFRVFVLVEVMGFEPTASTLRTAWHARAEAKLGPEFAGLVDELMFAYASTHREVHGPAFTAFAAPRLPAHDGRALGACYKRAARRGWIQKTDEFRPSPLSNGDPSPVWKSLIFRADSVSS